MNACKGPKAIAQLHEWYRSPLGAETAAVESACLDVLLSGTFGYYLIQVGLTECVHPPLAATRIRHCIRFAATAPLPGAMANGRLPVIQGALEHWPIASDSVDAVILPHVLELVPDPLAVLREVERVLIPDGRLIILGFNPFSLWGLWHYPPWLHRHLPWCGRWQSTGRLTAALAALGLTVEQRRYGLFRPPLAAAMNPRYAAVERIGQRLWPALGGIYALRAIKRVATLTPVKLSWRHRLALYPGRIAGPSTRDNGHVRNHVRT